MFGLEEKWRVVELLVGLGLNLAPNERAALAVDTNVKFANCAVVKLLRWMQFYAVIALKVFIKIFPALFIKNSAAKY